MGENLATILKLRERCSMHLSQHLILPCYLAGSFHPSFIEEYAGGLLVGRKSKRNLDIRENGTGKGDPLSNRPRRKRGRAEKEEDCRPAARLCGEDGEKDEKRPLGMLRLCAPRASSAN
jgi:hypothetical protein